MQRRRAAPRSYRAPQVQTVDPPVVPGEDAPSLTVTMLGAGQEVGRSCCLLDYRGKKVVCDTGVHPAFPGMGSLPFIDEVDWSTVDAILITQSVQVRSTWVRMLTLAAFMWTMLPHCRISWRR